MSNNHEEKGSKQRCLELVDEHHRSRADVAARLTKIIAPWGSVSEDDFWMPNSKDSTEAQLDKDYAMDFFISAEMRKLKDIPKGLLRRASIPIRLMDWWLNISAPTPHWDIASSCTINGKEGMLLVEAKSHFNEMNEQDKSDAKEPNRSQIVNALGLAQNGLNKVSSGWQFDIAFHYQLANRFAWSWKLCHMGIPVVLVYLGFLNDSDWPEDLFENESAWKDKVLDYSRCFVPSQAWRNPGDAPLKINGTELIPIIRSIEMPCDKR